MNKTKESWEEERTLREEFIRNFCNDHGKIRWLRGAFWDEEEKLNTILEYFDKYEKLLQSKESKYLKVLREIERYFFGKEKYEDEYNIILNILKKYNIEL